MPEEQAYCHESAAVDDRAQLGTGVRIWHWTAVREGARIGERTRIGQCCYVDHDVVIGSDCKIQNGVSVYHGVVIGNRVFVGPNATFTNDKYPRATNLDWTVVPTIVEDDASIGANATIICGVRLGKGCMVGAGAVVTADVPAFGLVLGQPARISGYVDGDGRPTRTPPTAGHSGDL